MFELLTVVSLLSQDSSFKIKDEIKVVNNHRVKLSKEAMEMALVLTVYEFIKLENKLNRPMNETANGIHFLLSTTPLTLKIVPDDITEADGCPYGLGHCSGIWLPDQRRIMLKMQSEQCLGETRFVHELIHALLNDFDHDADYGKADLPIAVDFPGKHPSDYFYTESSLEVRINEKIKKEFCEN